MEKLDKNFIQAAKMAGNFVLSLFFSITVKPPKDPLATPLLREYGA